MSIEYIRKAYGLTCKVGYRVRYSPPGETPREGKIVGATYAYLRIKMEDTPHAGLYHPTWCLEFLSEATE